MENHFRGMELSSALLDQDEIILCQFDPDTHDIDSVILFVDHVVNTFPNNKIIVLPKSVSVLSMNREELLSIRDYIDKRLSEM